MCVCDCERCCLRLVCELKYKITKRKVEEQWHLCVSARRRSGVAIAQSVCVCDDGRRAGERADGAVGCVHLLLCRSLCVHWAARTLRSPSWRRSCRRRRLCARFRARDARRRRSRALRLISRFGCGARAHNCKQPLDASAPSRFRSLTGLVPPVHRRTRPRPPCAVPPPAGRAQQRPP